MYLIKKRIKFLHLLMIVSVLSGCLGAKTDQEYIALAEESMNKGEFKAAIINLKNVLAVDGKNAEARYLLGVSYLNQGHWVSAEKELELAQKYNYDLSQVIPLLSKAYYQLGDIKGLENLVAQSEFLTLETQIILKTFIALTFIKEEFPDKGLNYLEEVIESDYDSKYIQLSIAWKHGINNELPQAIELIDNILASNKDFAEAIEYKAFLHFKQQEMIKSAEYFEKYIAIHPQAHELRMKLALALVYSEKYIDAEKHVDLLLKGMPENAKLNEIKAQTRFAQNDYKKAKQYAESAVRRNSTMVIARVIAGVSAYHLQQFEAAYSNLKAVKSNLSYKHPARKLFNTLRLQLGYEDELFAELSNPNNENIDVDTLSVSAIELFKIGKPNEANALLAQAAEQFPENANISYQQGMMKFYDKEDSAGLFFKKAVESNPELESALTMLLLEHLKKKEYQKAFDLAVKVETTNPELGLTYKGIIYAKKGELALAKDAYGSVLKLNEKNDGVNFKLGQVYELENNIDAAMLSYQNALKANIRFPLAVSALLKIGTKNTYQDKVQEFFETLRADNTREQMAHIYLASFYTVQSNPEMALKVLNDALSSIPNNYNLLMFKAKVQANSKDYNSALVSLDELSKLFPNSTEVIFAKSKVLEIKGDINGSIKGQEAILKLLPNSIDAKINLIQLHIKAQSLQAAFNVLNDPSLSGSSNITIKRLKGKVAFLRKNYTKAANILNEVFATLKDSDIALELATSLQKINKNKDALKIIEAYTQNVTSEVPLDIRLKQVELLGIESPNEALDIYNLLLDKTNRHFSMLNNVAMIYVEMNEPEKAIKFAKEAYEKASTNPIVLNTYGLALLASKDSINAEKYLKEAFLSNESDDNFKVHYAKALVENNKTTESKGVLLTVKNQNLTNFTLDMYKQLIK